MRATGVTCRDALSSIRRDRLRRLWTGSARDVLVFKATIEVPLHEIESRRQQENIDADVLCWFPIVLTSEHCCPECLHALYLEEIKTWDGRHRFSVEMCLEAFIVGLVASSMMAKIKPMISIGYRYVYSRELHSVNVVQDQRL